jgi:hypothetical protein
MEVVELQSADSLIRLIFHSTGEQILVAHDILERSPILVDCLDVIGEEGGTSRICAPDGFLLSWIGFLLRGKPFSDRDIDGIVHALKVLCVLPACLPACSLNARVDLRVDRKT